MRRLLALLASAILVMPLAACMTGPSAEEAAEWADFSLERQNSYAAFDPAGLPVSVKQYVLGTPDGIGYAKPDGIYTGWFLGAHERIGSDGTSHVFATFHIDGYIVGSEIGEIEVDLGPAPGKGIDVDLAVRGAGTCVVFLSRDGGNYALADGAYSISTTDHDGRLSMPLVEKSAQSHYLAGLIDVVDVAALTIAGRFDDGGVLNNDDGVSDSQKDAIDKANDLAGNG